MLLRPLFVFSAVILFSMYNGWAIINDLKHNHMWGCILSFAAVGGTFYFVHIYQKLRTTPAEEPENERIDTPAT